MYTVLFNSADEFGQPRDGDHQFMSGLFTYAIAVEIANNLEEEGFVAKAWVESE